MTLDSLEFNWRDKTIHIGIDCRGHGPTILMLPALSSISTRSEMRPLGQQLASIFTTIAIDWPGFGGPTAAVSCLGAGRLSGIPGANLTKVAETNGHSCSGSCSWLPALSCCRASWLRGAALSRCADMARAAADDDGRTASHVPVHIPTCRKRIVGVYTRGGTGADVGGSTVVQQMRCAFEAPPLSPAHTKPAIGAGASGSSHQNLSVGHGAR